MDSVNVRQLKDNPSRALERARSGPVLVLKGDVPEALLVHIDLDLDADGRATRLALAAALFKDEVVSLGRAARIAGVAVAEFIEHLGRLGIPVLSATPEELREDVRTLETWTRSS